MISQQLNDIRLAIINTYSSLFEQSLCPTKLQILCYYAQGYALAEDHELFPEDFQAWAMGPIISELYNLYIIDDIDHSSITIVDNIYTLEHINDVVSAYGKYAEMLLCSMIFITDPWLNARKGLDTLTGSTNLISKKSLKDFFTYKLYQQ